MNRNFFARIKNSRIKIMARTLEWRRLTMKFSFNSIASLLIHIYFIGMIHQNVSKFRNYHQLLLTYTTEAPSCIVIFLMVSLCALSIHDPILNWTDRSDSQAAHVSPDFNWKFCEEAYDFPWKIIWPPKCA